MSRIPDTRASLLMRIQNPDNRAAWAEFVEIYRPVIYRMARHRGFQDADAQDVVQQVLVRVNSSINDWDPGRDARFRSWLRTVTRNTIVDVIRMKRPDNGIGGSSVIRRLNAAPQKSAIEEVEHEYRRELFRKAAAEIENEFEKGTWAAFRSTMIERESVPGAASRLNKTIAAVYAARSRIMQRLKQRVKELEDQ